MSRFKFLILSGSVIMLSAMASSHWPQADLKALDGEWIYVEDRTPGKSLEEMGSPMSSRFTFATEEGVVILVSGHGSGLRNVRIKLDGTLTEAYDAAGKTTVRYRATWKDNTLTTEADYVRDGAQTPNSMIKRAFSVVPGGLDVKVSSDRSTTPSIGYYQHAQDIPLPTPAKAKIDDLKWLEGNWLATRPTGSTVEEKWIAPKGGAMLGTSRSVNTSGKMFAFEFLRVVERNEGLVYVAQPNGAVGTEFALVELTPSRAVFANPRHDYPKKIVYELSTDGKLSATVGYMIGGSPRTFEFKKE